MFIRAIITILAVHVRPLTVAFMRWKNFNPLKLARRSALSGKTERNIAVETLSDKVAPHIALGSRGEALAAEFLEARGYRLVASNFTLPVGRNLRGAIVSAEIDLIAYDGPTLCFIEVKTRASAWFAAPEANVDLRKQRQITRAARAYRRMFGLRDAPYRYDVVSVILPPPDENGLLPRPRLEVLQNFWTEAKFRKRRWTHAPDDD